MLALVYITQITATVLEVLGLAVTIFDIRAAQRRLAAYFSRPINVYLVDTISIADGLDRTVETAGEESRTLERRIDALEEWRRGVAAELDRRDERLLSQTGSRISDEVSAVRTSLNDRLEGLREYVVGEPRSHWWGIYRGPLLLVGGVLLGLFGNLVALATKASG